MSQFLRTLGVAVLAAALLDASAGLCFCHRGLAEPGSTPASHGCCHGADGSSTLAVQAAASCCHIEGAARDATPTDAVQLAPPPFETASVSESAGPRVALPDATAVSAPSPPVHNLRI